MREGAGAGVFASLLTNLVLSWCIALQRVRRLFSAMFMIPVGVGPCAVGMKDVVCMSSSSWVYRVIASRVVSSVLSM